MDSSGMKVPARSPIVLKIDPKTRKLMDGSLFQAYLPMTIRNLLKRGSPSDHDSADPGDSQRRDRLRRPGRQRPGADAGGRR